MFARFDANSNDVPYSLGGEGRVPGFPTIVRYREREGGGYDDVDFRTVGEGITVEGILEFVEAK